jgi:hypothetical protein
MTTEESELCRIFRTDIENKLDHLKHKPMTPLQYIEAREIIEEYLTKAKNYNVVYSYDVYSNVTQFGNDLDINIQLNRSVEQIRMKIRIG